MHRLVLIAALTLLLVQPALAGERLLVPQMPGWTVLTTHRDPGAEVTEMIPAAETADNWTRRISVQAFRTTTMTATEFLEGLVVRTEEVCEGGSAAEPLRPLRLGPLQAGRRALACGRYRGDGKGTYTLYYAIRGNEALYVVARAWRGQPFAAGVVKPVTSDELADWNATFDAVQLCDDADPQRRCPK